MIRSFRHWGLKRLHENDDPSRIAPALRDKVRRVLSALEAAESPQALDLPGYRLQPLKGSLAAFWSVTVSGNWRITTKGCIQPMKNPSHPGAIVRYDCIEPLGLTVTEAAKILGVTRQALNNLVNGKAGVSAEMAVRLSKAFGSEPEFWLRLQMNYDLAQVRRREADINVKRFRKAS